MSAVPIWLIVALSGVLFLLHLLCELLTVFYRYGFAAKSEFMQGMVIANYFGIASRVFITAFGVVAAWLVESGQDVAVPYMAMISAILVASAAGSLLLSGREIAGTQGPDRFRWHRIRLPQIDPLPRIRAYEAFLFGSQFVVLAVAYGISFKFPQYRLTIVSAVPIVTMLGTLVTMVVIEPRYARIIDRHPIAAIAITRLFLRARASSFLSSGICLAAVLAYIVGSGR